MMRGFAVLACGAAGLVSGCVTPDEDIPTREDRRFACSDAALSRMVGQIASTGVGTEAMRAANARTIRWIRPGDIVTAEFRADRLNIDLDAANRIVRLRCG